MTDPAQHPALVPELAVTDYPASRDFYCAVLGFRLCYERPEEGFGYLALGAAELMLDQIGLGRDFDAGHLPHARPYGRGMNLQIRVPELAPLLAQLAAVDWPLVVPQETQWYRENDTEHGQTQCVVADPDGYLLRFFQELGSRPVDPTPPPTT